MKPIIGLLILGCLAARPSAAQWQPAAFRPLPPPPPYTTPATLNLPDTSDYTMEGALIGGAGLGLFGLWFGREMGGNPRAMVTGALIGATIGTTLGGMIGSGIPKGPCCREEPAP